MTSLLARALLHFIPVDAVYGAVLYCFINFGLRIVRQVGNFYVPQIIDPEHRRRRFFAHPADNADAELN